MFMIMTDLATRLASLTPEQLRTRGSLKWTAPAEGRIGAWVAEMDFGFAPPVAEAVRSVAETGALGYLPAWMEADLGEACAAFQREHFGWEPSPADVHSVSDVLTVLQIALNYYTRPGGAVILPTPAYMPFFEVPPAAGRRIIEVPMAEQNGYYTMDLDGISAAFDAGGEILILCNPHNPTGRVFDAAELAAVCEVVDRHGGLVFADEIHAPLTYPGGPPHIPYASLGETAAGHTVTAVSASKAFNLPGLKCAQAILSDSRHAHIWSTLPGVVQHSAATIGVAAAIAAYRDGGPYLAEVREYLADNRALLADRLMSQLPGVGFRPPDGTYLAWLDFRGLDLPEPPGSWIDAHAGVLLNEGGTFGDPGRGFVRLNMATPRHVLAEIVDRIAAALAAR